jgi:hypothetical protein
MAWGVSRLALGHARPGRARGEVEPKVASDQPHRTVDMHEAQLQKRWLPVGRLAVGFAARSLSLRAAPLGCRG